MNAGAEQRRDGYSQRVGAAAVERRGARNAASRPGELAASSHARSPIAAQAAMRAAIQRALDARLPQTDLRVLLAIMTEVCFFDRLSDRVANSVIVDRTGVDERHVRRSLQNLSEAGVIVREPGRTLRGGLRLASLITFPESDPEGAGVALPWEAIDARLRGADPDLLGGRKSARQGGAYVPASEAPSEVLSEALSPACPSTERAAKNRALASPRREGRVEEALQELADRDLAKAVNVRSARGYRETVLKSRQRDHAALLRRLADEQPLATARELADAVCPPDNVVVLPRRREGPCGVARCGGRWEDRGHDVRHRHALADDPLLELEPLESPDLGP